MRGVGSFSRSFTLLLDVYACTAMSAIDIGAVSHMFDVILVVRVMVVLK